MKLFIASILIAAVAPFAFAHPEHPPKEAFDACTNHKQGDACTVKLRDFTLDGTCITLPDQADLVCRPNHPPPPPPQAFEACRGASEGDACSFEIEDHTVSGTCVNKPDGNGPLACRPDHRR